MSKVSDVEKLFSSVIRKMTTRAASLDKIMELKKFKNKTTAALNNFKLLNEREAIPSEKDFDNQMKEFETKGAMHEIPAEFTR